MQRNLQIVLTVLFISASSVAQTYWEKVDSIFSPSGVVVKDFSAPAYGDIDNDGDDDLMIGNIDSKADFFENIGTRFSPQYQRVPEFLDFMYSGGTVNTNADYPVITDINGDNKLDIIVSGYNKILFYKNVGTLSEPSFVQDTLVFSESVNPHIGRDARAFFADIDADGDKDLFVGTGETLYDVGPDAGKTLGFRNTGTAANPAFTRDDSFVAGIPDVGTNAYPTLADLDNDGDYDLLMGRDGGAFFFYKNNGTPQSPSWTREYTTFSAVETTTYWKDPAFTDIDGDNDLDLVYGQADGELYVYLNSGNINQPQFSTRSTSYYEVLKADGPSALSFADVDNDGDQDMISGSNYSGFIYYENKGNPWFPRLQLSTAPFSGINPGFRPSPVFVDLDNDGDVDIVSGADNGQLFYYKNDNNKFTLTSSVLPTIDVGYGSFPALADMNGDGLVDLLVGAEQASAVTFFLNNGTSFVEDTTIFSGVTFYSSTRPGLADIDNDGDIDLFIGLWNGTFAFYENIGTAQSPAWQIKNSLTEGLKVKQNAYPAFADLHLDRRTDLVVGEYDGNFTYFKNLFAAPLPVELTSFTASVSGGFVSLSWNTASETNNRGFEIQRRAAAEEWKAVGFKKGMGTTSELTSYLFIDNLVNLPKGNVYYRLKQMDFDGSYEYSDEIEIQSAPGKFALSANYPNPFNPVTVIEFGISEPGLVSLKVYNILGEEAAVLINEVKEPGYYRTEFNAASLPSGVYFYTLNAGKFSETKKMTLTR